MAMSHTRLVGVLAGLAFAIGACGGGGSGTRPVVSAPTTPTPTQPTTPAPPANPFRTTGSEIGDGCCYRSAGGEIELSDFESIPAGLTLENFVASGVRFSQFDLEGDPDRVDSFSGIPVHVDTGTFTDSDGEITAIAYRVILDHGEMLLATTLDSPAVSYSFLNHMNFRLGTPTPAGADTSALSGTWRGIAVGQEQPVGRGEARVPASVRHARDLVVEGGVSIIARTGGGTAPSVSVGFGFDEDDGTYPGGWPDARFLLLPIYIPGSAGAFSSESVGSRSFYRFFFNSLDLSDSTRAAWNTATAGDGHFYGPRFENILGSATFEPRYHNRRLNVYYGAKKQ